MTETDEPWLGRVEALLSGTRIGQFVTVGGLGAVVDTGTLLLLTTQAGLYRGEAKVVSAELAIVLMFFINEHWTFAAEGAPGLRALLHRLVKSNLVRIGGVAVATVVFVGVSGIHVDLPYGGRALWLTISNVIGIGVGFVVNYVAESLVTWRVGVDLR